MAPICISPKQQSVSVVHLAGANTAADSHFAELRPGRSAMPGIGVLLVAGAGEGVGRVAVGMHGCFFEDGFERDVGGRECDAGVGVEEFGESGDGHVGEKYRSRKW